MSMETVWNCRLCVYLLNPSPVDMISALLFTEHTMDTGVEFSNIFVTQMNIEIACIEISSKMTHLILEGSW